MLLEQIFDVSEMNNLTFMRVLKNLSNFSIANMAGNETQRELQTMI